MARCGCSGSACACIVTALDTESVDITITGTGSAGDPFVISADATGGSGPSFDNAIQAFLTAEVTTPSTAVTFDAPLSPSPDITVTGGEIEFLTTGLYAIAFDAFVSFDAAADGQFAFFWDYGASTLPNNNFLWNGNGRDRISVVPNTTSVGTIFTLPPMWFNAGNTLTIELNTALLTAGSYTLLDGSSMYVVRLA